MARLRSDIGWIQARDVKCAFDSINNNNELTGVIIHFRELKGTQVKTTRLGIIGDKQFCPTTILKIFMDRTTHIRTALPEDRTLLLAYIEHPDKVSSIKPSTASKWVKDIMQLSSIDPTQYKAHSICSASSTKAIEKVHSIQTVKEHANWSLNSNSFENFYYKPTAQQSSSTAIATLIFLPENTITSFDFVLPTF